MMVVDFSLEISVIKMSLYHVPKSSENIFDYGNETLVLAYDIHPNFVAKRISPKYLLSFFVLIMLCLTIVASFKQGWC